MFSWMFWGLTVPPADDYQRMLVREQLLVRLLQLISNPRRSNTRYSLLRYFRSVPRPAKLRSKCEPMVSGTFIPTICVGCVRAWTWVPSTQYPLIAHGTAFEFAFGLCLVNYSVGTDTVSSLHLYLICHRSHYLAIFNRHKVDPKLRTILFSRACSITSILGCNQVSISNLVKGSRDCKRHTQDLDQVSRL